MPWGKCQSGLRQIHTVKRFAYQAKELGHFPMHLWDTDKVSEVAKCFQQVFLM